jgi:hypothetical protein
VPPVEVLIVAGFHVPVIPFVDVVGKAGAVVFWQSGPIAAKVGATRAVTSTLIVAVEAHCPSSGVKV